MSHSLGTKLSGLRHKGYITDIEYQRLKKALEQEPCKDAISRQAVCDMLEDINAETEGVGFYYEHYVDYIKSLPSVRPQQPCDVSDTNIGNMSEEPTDSESEDKE